MKKYILIFVSFLLTVSCQDFLKEESISIQTTDGYYINEAGFEDLVKSNYELLRDIHKDRDLVFMGTDIFTSNGWNQVADGNQGGVLNVYDVRFNATMGSVNSLWNLLYKQIGRTNTTISRQGDIQGMDEGLKAIRVGEAKFLRAFAYFYLVQQFGDIPMPLEETVTGSREVIKVSSAEVYSQIIKDLTEAEAVLPTANNTEYGRATKGAAQFLLARVYLTRGWNFNESLGGSPADFDKAVEYADKVIASYPMVSDYKTLFPLHAENPLEETFPDQNDKNSEVIFAVQYSDNVLTNGAGNDYHSIFGGGAEDIPGAKGRTSEYNRHGAIGNYFVTPAAYRLFDPQRDTRYEHNFVDAMYALSDVKDFVPNAAQPDVKIDIARGDTVLFFPPWNRSFAASEKGMDVGGNKTYAVLNIDDIGINDQTPYHVRNKTPLMWKFWQPGIPYDDAMGTFDFALFRSAEAYLIAAEAILKGANEGNLGSAEVYYNSVVDRALGIHHAGVDPQCAKEPANLTSLETVSYRANGNLTIDMILDERARELMGEYCRWYDLKRTEKFIERTSAMNPWTAAIGQMEEKHYLRPIPQAEIDRSIPSIAQNSGF